jgi:hypothetical protein
MSVALADARRLLSSWLDRRKFKTEHRGSDRGADLVVEHGDVRFIVELKLSSDAVSIGAPVLAGSSCRLVASADGDARAPRLAPCVRASASPSRG